MLTRHRVPTIFTLYMVDVLCCALGCVILLWFLKIHEAKDQRLAIRQTGEQLATTRSQLQDVTGQVTDVRERLQVAENERDRTRTERDLAHARSAALDKDLAALKVANAANENRLAKSLQDYRDLTAELARTQQHVSKLTEDLANERQQAAKLTEQLSSTRQQAASLEALLREKETLVRKTAQSADELAGRLRETDAQARELRSLAALLPGLREELRTTRDKLSAMETRALNLENEISSRKKDLADSTKSLKVLEETARRLTQEIADRDKELAAARRSLAALQTDKKTLTELAQRVQQAAENRFAGITLTGRRVVFLVDMSGSMEMVDEQTLAPEKWSAVREALAKVMRSLPDLQKFQVILFSDKVTYVLGHSDSWLDYDPKTGVDQTVSALSAIKPKGSTNMYLAMEHAFRFRPAGMDTIYLFSDGLPNVGAGLTPEEARSLRESDREQILSKYIRKMLAATWNPKTGSDGARVRINTIGFFFESPDVGAFLWALARENDGSFVGMSKP